MLRRHCLCRLSTIPSPLRVDLQAITAHVHLVTSADQVHPLLVINHVSRSSSCYNYIQSRRKRRMRSTAVAAVMIQFKPSACIPACPVPYRIR